MTVPLVLLLSKFINSPGVSWYGVQVPPYFGNKNKILNINVNLLVSNFSYIRFCRVQNYKINTYQMNTVQ